MGKQPKFFYSRSKPLKIPTVTKLTAEELVVPGVVSQEVVLTPSERKIPQTLLFGLGFLTLIGLTSLGAYSYQQAHGGPVISLQPFIFKETAAVTQQAVGNPQGLTFDVRTADARVDIVANFLTRYKSPLQPAETYARQLVAAADRYGLDYRLLPAIMMQESNLCKTSDPKLHNCLGFGIHKGGTLGFDSYEESFDRAARELKEKYIDIGLTTPEQIMTKYTPSSNGSWARSVNQWIAEMEHNDRDVGLTLKTDANLLEYTSSR